MNHATSSEKFINGAPGTGWHDETLWMTVLRQSNYFYFIEIYLAKILALS